MISADMAPASSRAFALCANAKLPVFLLNYVELERGGGGVDFSDLVEGLA
jgi:hypothetical protein